MVVGYIFNSLQNIANTVDCVVYKIIETSFLHLLLSSSHVFQAIDDQKLSE
jgi:hypothetical protein